MPILLCDKFANYVVQKALALAPYDMLDSILAIVKGNLDTLRNSTVGKRIFLKLTKSYPSLFALK